MATNYDDLDSLIQLDATDLAAECADQANRYHHYVLKAVAARNEHAVADADLDILKADLYLRIANSPSEYGLEKSTVDSIKASVLVQPEYRDAVTRLNQAKRDAGVFQGAVDTLDQRKRMIELMVQLAVNGLHADPVLPRNSPAIDAHKVTMEKRRQARTPR